MGKIIREEFKGFGGELLASIRERVNEYNDDAVFTEKIIGIQKATVSMLELGIADEDIIQMLQKHWDLRRSEAVSFIEENRNI